MLKLSVVSYCLAFVILSALVFSLDLNSTRVRQANAGNTLPTSARIAQLFTSTKTICIGRFLLDVPRSAQVVYGPAYIPWPINSYMGKGEKIAEIVSERLVEIDKEKLSASGELRSRESYVGEVISGTKPGQK